MKKVSKEMLISEIIAMDSGIVQILLNSGMHCVGCPAAQAESLAEAGSAHGVKVDELVDEINDFLAKAS